MKALIALSALALAACATNPKVPEPIIQIVEVKVPVPFACVPKLLGPAPTYVDEAVALLNGKDAADRYRLVYAGRLQRIARLNELEPVVKSCRKEQ